MRWSLPKLGVPKTVVILLYMFLSQMFPSERVITVHPGEVMEAKKGDLHHFGHRAFFWESQLEAI